MLCRECLHNRHREHRYFSQAHSNDVDGLFTQKQKWATSWLLELQGMKGTFLSFLAFFVCVWGGGGGGGFYTNLTILQSSFITWNTDFVLRTVGTKLVFLVVIKLVCRIRFREVCIEALQRLGPDQIFRLTGVCRFQTLAQNKVSGLEFFGDSFCLSDIVITFWKSWFSWSCQHTLGLWVRI